jgi:hypothetical protein
MLSFFNFDGSGCFDETSFPFSWLPLKCGYDFFENKTKPDFFEKHMKDSKLITFDKYLSLLIFLDLDPGIKWSRHDKSYQRFSRYVATLFYNAFVSWLNEHLKDTTP